MEIWVLYEQKVNESAVLSDGVNQQMLRMGKYCLLISHFLTVPSLNNSLVDAAEN